MNLQHVNAKMFVEGDLTIDLERFMEVFHRWVAEQSLDELLIDVADYRHVPAGPSVVLVGHEADYVMDNTGNRYGLLYNRKAALDGSRSNSDRFQQALASAARVCSLLEAEFAGLKFSRSEFELSINDRALAPNTEEASAACRTEMEEFLQAGLGASDVSIDYDRDPRRVFGGVVKLSTPLDFAALGD